MPAVLLGQNNLPEEPDSEELETHEFPEDTHMAAFMILIDLNGNYIFEPDINAIVIPKRKPTPSEVKGAMSAILMDIQSQETAIMTAQATVQTQMQMARAMSEQQQNAQIAQQLNKRR
jgi:hypothetical protein